MSEPRPFSLSDLDTDGALNPYAEGDEPTPTVHRLTAFPEIIDNTARDQFFLCPKKFQYSTINKLAPRYVSEHLHFGGAFATGLEHARKGFYDLGLTQQKAIDHGIVAAIEYYGDYTPPEKSFKTFENLVLALEFYASEYPFAKDHVRPHKLASGFHAVEFTFAIPLPLNHPVTGNPLIYAGRFDMLAQYKNALFVFDDKTASRLGTTWSSQWGLNSQITGYAWAAQQSKLPVVGAIIRGQSILKNGFEIQEAIVYRPQWMIDRWYKQLLKDIKKMLKCWMYEYQLNKPDSFDYAIGSACNMYSGCEFRKLCSSRTPEDWIQTEYRQRHWNPLEKDPEKSDISPEMLPPVDPAERGII